MKPVHVWIIFAALFVLHHDFWWWDDRSIVLGFMPVGLAWHVLFSIAAASLWVLALKFAWPQHIEEWAEGDGAGASGSTPAAGQSPTAARHSHSD